MMDDKIIQLIRENLNSIESDTFVKEFTRLQGVEKKFESLNNELDLMKEENRKLSKENKVLRDSADNVSIREDNVLSREKELSKLSTDLKIKEEIQKAEKEFYTSRINDHKEMVSLIFRNPITTNTVSTISNTSVPTRENGCVYYDNNHTNGTTTTTTVMD